MFQEAIDGLVVLAMFFLRIGVPIVITLGIGVWLEKKLHPQETHQVQRPVRRGTIIPFPRAPSARIANFTPTPSASSPDRVLRDRSSPLPSFAIRTEVVFLRAAKFVL